MSAGVVQTGLDVGEQIALLHGLCDTMEQLNTDSPQIHSIPASLCAIVE